MGRTFDAWESFWVYNPGGAEAFLHRKLKKHRREGEWFAVAPVLNKLTTYLEGRQVTWPGPPEI